MLAVSLYFANERELIDQRCSVVWVSNQLGAVGFVLDLYKYSSFKAWGSSFQSRFSPPSQAQSGPFELAGLAMGGAWIAERLAGDLGLAHYGVINVAFTRCCSDRLK